ncbi:MAG: DUF6249 domain-containing protein [Nannocystaceae bacterium]
MARRSVAHGPSSLHALRVWGPVAAGIGAFLAFLADARAAVLAGGRVEYGSSLRFLWSDLWLFEGRLLGHIGPVCRGLQLSDIVFLAVLALILLSAIRFRYVMARRRLELARRMVEQGLEPPSELWGASARGDLRRGIVLLCAGAGLLLASRVSGRSVLSPMGLVPAFVGLGYLLSYRFAPRGRGR